MEKVVICGINTGELPCCTANDAENLLLRIKQGDENARNEFIIKNIRLVLSVIKRFWSKKANSDDVFQAGCIGLIKAIDNFDLSVGVKFSTYAVPMIIGEIKRFLRDVNSLRISRSIRDTAYEVLKTRTELEKDDVMDHCYIISFKDSNNNIIAGFTSDSIPKIENDGLPYIFKVYLD